MAAQKQSKKRQQPAQKKVTLAQRIAAGARAVAKSSFTKPLANAAMEMLDKKGYDHARMFYDPCHAPLAESSYRGEKGYINRFTNDFTLVVGVSGEMFIGLVPQGWWYAINSAATTGTTFTLTAGQGNTPGYTFCSTNATRYRVIGACITVTPLGTLTNQTGQVWFGNVGARELISDTGAAIGRTVASMQQLLPTNITATSIINGGLDVKWVPSQADEWYAGMSPTGAGIDYSSVNGLCIVGTGLPNGSSVNVRATLIVEWIPAPGLGIASDPTDFPSPSKNTVWDVLGWLKRRDANWWFNHAGKLAVSAGKAAIGMLPGAAAAKAAVAFL